MCIMDRRMDAELIISAPQDELLATVRFYGKAHFSTGESLQIDTLEALKLVPTEQGQCI